MPKSIRSKPLRKLTEPDRNPQRWRDLQRRTTALARWDGEGDAALPGPQHEQEPLSGAGQARTPALTDAELVQLHKRVVALENVVIALLARAPDSELSLVREMATYISPRPGFTHHPVTVRAAAQMNHLVERAGRFLAPPC
jgi:hypothetical protein